MSTSPIAPPSSLSPSYRVARAAFLAAAEQAGARIEHHLHPLTGLEGEELAVDVAELGPPDATKVVVIVSATHGVEGYSGSALQRHLLEHAVADRPDDLRLVVVHALNPYGFSWVRRVNEDNVDLNRNFVDWSKPAPANERYDSMARLVVPTEWTDEVLAAAMQQLLALVEQWGYAEFQAAVSGGQFTDPTGVFYGGVGPTWSHRWLTTWLVERLAPAQHVAIIDLHTGLGPWGHGELIGSEPNDSPVTVRARGWWGEVTSMFDGDSVSAVIAGDWLAVVPPLLPHATVTPVALEYGTVDGLTVLQSLRADAWLHAHGDPTDAHAATVRAQVRAAFADDDPAWLAALWPRFHGVVRAAFEHVGN